MELELYVVVNGIEYFEMVIILVTEKTWKPLQN